MLAFTAAAGTANLTLRDPSQPTLHKVGTAFFGSGASTLPPACELMKALRDASCMRSASAT